MQLPGIPGIIFSALLMSGTTAGEEGRGQAPSGGTQVEVEVIEVGAGAADPVVLTAPVEGRIEAAVDGSKGRHCKVEVHRSRRGHHLDLQCSGPDQGLRVETTQLFTSGARVKVAEVKRSQGPTSQVFVTLR
ncbi:MAG: hypothetical protein R3B09_03265 [Nannocystaceae bacterium]